MNNRGIIITLIVLLLIIIIGLIAFLVLCLTGKAGLPFLFNWSKKYTTVIIDEVYTSSEINNINVISQAGDVTFKESTDNQIRVVVCGKKAEDYQVSNNYGTLKVEQNANSNNHWFNFNSYIGDITIYLPNNYENEISIKINYGDCVLTSLENANIDIDSDCGDVKLGTAKNIKIDSSLGDIKIDTVLNKCNIESNCGDIDIDNANIKEDSSIKSDLGDVKIKNVSDAYVDAKVDLGDIKIKNNNRHSEIILKIDNDCGDIKVGE